MYMRRMITVLFFFLLPGMVLGSRIIPLPGLNNPDSITVEKDRVYITDGASVYIYTLSEGDLRLVKSFGKKGEGPREFRVAMGATARLDLNLLENEILINSIGRVSFFSREGRYLKEIQAASGANFKPLGKGFVGYSSTRDDRLLYLTINFYNASLQKVKEIFRKDYYVQGNKNFNLAKLGTGNKRRAVYGVSQDKLFVEGENDVIHVFDENGNKAYDIPLDYEKLAIAENRKQTIMKDLDLLFGPYMRKLIRRRGYFPKNFPARIFTVAQGKIYIPTYQKKQGKTRFIIFTTGGKLIKKTYLPFKDQRLLLPYPYTVDSDNLYQLYDNEETESWELHIHRVL